MRIFDGDKIIDVKNECLSEVVSPNKLSNYKGDSSNQSSLEKLRRFNPIFKESNKESKEIFKYIPIKFPSTSKHNKMQIYREAQDRITMKKDYMTLGSLEAKASRTRAAPLMSGEIM